MGALPHISSVKETAVAGLKIEFWKFVFSQKFGLDEDFNVSKNLSKIPTLRTFEYKPISNSIWECSNFGLVFQVRFLYDMSFLPRIVHFPFFSSLFLWCTLKWQQFEFTSWSRIRVSYFLYRLPKGESVYSFYPCIFRILIISLFFLSFFFLSFFLPLCVCTFLDPWLKKSINQLFTGAGTLTSLILELEKFWRQFWKSHN